MHTEFSADMSLHGCRCEPSARPETIRADALVVFLTEGGIRGAAADIDRATGGLLSRLAAAGEITGKRYECIPILAPAGIRLLGLDDNKLTYYHAGRFKQLSQFGGTVIKNLIA